MPLPRIIPHHSHVFGQASILQPTCSLWKAHMGDTAWPVRYYFYKHTIKFGKTWMKRYIPDHTMAIFWHPLQHVPAKKSDNFAPPLLIWSASPDHHPHRVHLTRPLHFFTLLDRTFANGSVFSVCHPQPLHELLFELKRAVPTTLRKTYAWGFNWTPTPISSQRSPSYGKLLDPSSATPGTFL